jgi:rhomboid-like protein
MAAYSYYYIAQSWVNLTEGKEICYKLVGCFIGVYVLSSIPAARQIARRVFSHDPLSGRVSSLFTSQFGHAGLLHLGVNSFALIGFGIFSVIPSVLASHIFQASLHGVIYEASRPMNLDVLTKQ